MASTGECGDGTKDCSPAEVVKRTGGKGRAPKNCGEVKLYCSHPKMKVVAAAMCPETCAGVSDEKALAELGLSSWAEAQAWPEADETVLRSRRRRRI